MKQLSKFKWTNSMKKSSIPSTTFYFIVTHSSIPSSCTVGLGTMAQHARLWALPVAKLAGQSKIACNITLGKFIELYHIQSSLLYNKNCGLQTSKHSFFRPYLKGLSRLVRWPKPQNSAVSQPIGIRFGVSMHL